MSRMACAEQTSEPPRKPTLILAEKSAVQGLKTRPLVALPLSEGVTGISEKFGVQAYKVDAH